MTDEEHDETTVIDDEDAPKSEDHYERKNGPATAAELFPMLTELELVSPSRDASWWSARDREIAELRAKEIAQGEIERMQRRATDLRDRGGFPVMFVDAAMRVPSATPAMTFARRYVHLPSKVFVFAGGVGVGKTTAATWLAMKGDDHDPGFVRASTLERRGRYDKSLDAWLKERTSLVIDDLGVEVLDSKRVFASLLDEIVDMFYAKRQMLIMTTNLLAKVTDEDRAAARAEGREPEPQFVERYGDRVRSRLRQIGQWAHCGTLDLRKPTTGQA